MAAESDLILEEARRAHDARMERLRGIEAKAGRVVGVNSLILAFVGVFGEIASPFQTVILSVSLVSTAIGLFVSSGYSEFPNPSEEFVNGAWKRSKSTGDLIDLYRWGAEEKNDIDYLMYVSWIGYVLTFISLFTIGIVGILNL